MVAFHSLHIFYFIADGLESYGNEGWIDLEALDLERQIRIEAILNEENEEFSLTETDINGEYRYYIYALALNRNYIE